MIGEKDSTRLLSAEYSREKAAHAHVGPQNTTLREMSPQFRQNNNAALTYSAVRLHSLQNHNCVAGTQTTILGSERLSSVGELARPEIRCDRH